MNLKRVLAARVLPAIGVSTALVLSVLTPSEGSSHREAPLSSQDPPTDLTDVYAFVSPDDADTVTLIANVIPFEDPAGGPNFYGFAPDVLYRLNVDNDGDGSPNVLYDFRFQKKTQNGGTFLYNTGVIDSVTDPDFNHQMTYTVSEWRNGVRTTLGSNLEVPPVNVGVRSTPDYGDLADEAVHTVGDTKVFAGPRDDPFFVDLGSIFDLAALRPINSAHLIPRANEAGKDYVAGYNVHSLALQVPKTDLVDGDPTIGVWATTYRRKGRNLPPTNGYRTIIQDGPWVQVSRLGMPLVNEVVIPYSQKNKFNNSLPTSDGQFLSYVTNPELGTLLPALYPGAFTCFPTGTRNDLVSVFLTGITGLNQPAGVTPSEQLRLNTSIAPAGAPNRLGVLASDNAGFPNGRRLIDDVTDIELRVVAGASPLGSCSGQSPNDDLSDGVDANDKAFTSSFPYLAEPTDGYSS